MKKIISVLGALTVASSPTIVLRNITPHKTQNLNNIVQKTNQLKNNINSITIHRCSRLNFWFSVYLTNSGYNGFSGFLDQISFKLSDDNYHAWPIFLFQYLDDDDFNHPMPGLNDHLKHGFFHYALPFADRLETHMGGFGNMWEDDSRTTFNMSSSWGTWGTFGQTVDNQWNADRAASKPLVGIQFNFAFDWYGANGYETDTPSFNITMAS